MLQALMNLLSLCFRPFGQGSSSNSGTKFQSFVGISKEGKDGLLWYRDIGRYGSGEFSMAVVQANQVLEDQSQIESGPFGTFVGVYDGHGGPEAARFVCDHLFRHFQGLFFLKTFFLSALLYLLKSCLKRKLCWVLLVGFSISLLFLFLETLTGSAPFFASLDEKLFCIV
jgi:hypothetical protein